MTNNSLSQIIVLLIICLGYCFAEYIPPGPKYRCPENPLTIFPCECLKGSDKGLYIRCENTNLASLSIAFENFANRKYPLENVTIYKSHIERLYGSIFYKVDVRVLNFEDTPIKTINENTFYGINNTLQELHIINSELLEFSAEAFKVLGNLLVLNIDGHRIQKLQKDIFVDSLAAGKLERLHFVNGPLDDLPVESFQLLRKLKTLDLHGNQLSVLKRNQFKNLRDVEILDISFNKIAKLESQHIADLTKLGFINVSHNAITDLPRGTFARNSVLKVLNLSHNKIKRLDTNSFRGMRFLRRLYMSDNLITDVGRGTFGSVTRIGTIDLARNMLKKIDFQMFFQLNFVEVVNLAENNITEIQKQSFKSLYTTMINISHNAIEKIERFAFEDCSNMSLDLSHNLLRDLDRDTFDSTTYAVELQLSYNFLQDLAQIPLHNMTGLKVLNVSHNELTGIAKNTFPKLYELHTIDVSYNNISSIYNAVFQSLFSLRNLNLSHNSMEEIKSPTFGTIPTLLDMDLSYNKLKLIARGAMAKMTSLRFLNLRDNNLEKIFQIPISLNHLDLRNNWLQEVPDRTWPQMNALLSLDLSGNRLANNLSRGSFTGLLTLQSLYLNSNGISLIPADSLTDLSTLQYLHLQNNNITKLPKAAFGKLPVVFELNLYNNNINNISVRAFDGLLQLLTLNLSSNALKTIPNDAFIGLVSLRKMDLSHNSLEKLDNKTNGVLDDCLSLEYINLSHNRISFVTRKTFPSNPWIPYKLREIDLSYNRMPVLTYDLTFGTKKAKKINFSHNSINDIRRNVLGNISSLEILDLSFNGLTDLVTEKNIFVLPPNISEIYVQNNKIHQFPFEELEKVNNISKIDLSNNELPDFASQLTNLVKNGSQVLFGGNPLKCDCGVRPLRHYLMKLTTIPDYFNDIQCSAPSHLSGQPLTEIEDERLHCASSEKYDAADEEYDVLPDLKFREIVYAKGKLFLRWYVTSRNDVADFYINVRDNKNVIYFEQSVAYNARYIEIPSGALQDAISASEGIQVCVLAKDSMGVVSGLYESQCTPLPKNFAPIVHKYNEEYNYEYTLFSLDPRKFDRKSYKSSAQPASTCNIVIFALMFALIFISNLCA